MYCSRVCVDNLYSFQLINVPNKLECFALDKPFLLSLLELFASYEKNYLLIYCSRVCVDNLFSSQLMNAPNKLECFSQKAFPIKLIVPHS